MRVTMAQRNSRPNIHTCHVCGGLPLLEVTGNDGLLYLVDCPACSGRGYIDRQEWHPAAWLPKWAFNLAVFVGVL